MPKSIMRSEKPRPYGSKPTWRKGVIWTAAAAFGFAILSLVLSIRQVQTLNQRLFDQTTLAARTIAGTASELALQELDTALARVAFGAVISDQHDGTDLAGPVWFDGVYVWTGDRLVAVRHSSDKNELLESFIMNHVAEWVSTPPSKHTEFKTRIIREAPDQIPLTIGLLPFRAIDGKSGAVVANLDVEKINLETVDPLLKLHGGLELARIDGDSDSWNQPMTGVLADWALKPEKAYLRTHRRAIIWQVSSYLGLAGLALGALLASMGLLWRVVRRETALAQMKANFVADVSHELKTPLATIRLYCETLESGRVASDEKRLEYYRTIARESTRLSNMINTILDFSRIEAGHEDFDLQLLDVGEVVRETYQGFQLKLDQENFDYQLKIEPQLPRVLANRDRISQAILNLMSNAVKYSEDERFLSIEVTRDTRRGRRGVLISVHDRGIGIQPEERAHLFEGFFRSNDNRVRQRGGTGLGLALVKEIVDAHHGLFQVESRLVKGSTFRIFLPEAENHPPNTEDATLKSEAFDKQADTD